MKRDIKRWADLDKSRQDAISDITYHTRGLHPTDLVEYYRDVAKHANDAANQQSEVNDRDGVPE